MTLNYDGIKINIEIHRRRKNYLLPIIFIHGFTGSAFDWKEFFPKIDKKFLPMAIDLIGHGKTDTPKSVEFYSEQFLHKLIIQLYKNLSFSKAVLLGYSMGGRAAISFAVENPGLLAGLILESSSAGINDQKLRRERQQSDEKLAQFVLSNPIEQFVDYWMNIELFNTQRLLPEDKQAEIRNRKLKSNPVGLANSLKGFGTGQMNPLYDRLPELNVKTLLITGEEDHKFTSINTEMRKLLPLAEHEIISRAGHNVHLEQPEKFILSVNNFLNAF